MRLSPGFLKPAAAAAGGYEAEAEALFARMTTPPTTARKDLINAVFVALKSSPSILTKLDVLHVLAAHDAQAARLNWLSSSFTATEVSAPTFTADRGYAGNGTSSYVNMNFNPSSAAGQFVNGDACFGFWSRTSAGQSNDPAGFRAASVPSTTINPRVNGGDYATGRLDTINDDGSFVSNVTDATGLFVLKRATNTLSLRRNDAEIFSITSFSETSVTNGAFKLGTANTTNYSTMQFAAALAGAGLTAAQHTRLYDALAAYMTAVGAA